MPEKDYRLALSYDACGYPPSRTLPVGALLFEERGGRLVARARGGGPSFEAVELFGGVLSVLTAGAFRMLSSGRHTPRVEVDGLVVQREAWGFGAEEVGWADEGEAALRYAGARRWGREAGLPRHSFVRVRGERKPLYLDLESPVLVEVVARAARRAGGGQEGGRGGTMVEVAEMLPGPGGAWLEDAAGRRYTSEFRLVVVDQKP